MVRDIVPFLASNAIAQTLNGFSISLYAYNEVTYFILIGEIQLISVELGEFVLEFGSGYAS